MTISTGVRATLGRFCLLAMAATQITAAYAVLPDMSPALRPLFESLLRSPQGRELGLALYGRPGAQGFNSAAAHEFEAALLQPRNQAIYTEFMTRLRRVGNEMNGVVAGQDARLAALFEREFALAENEAGRIRFRDAANSIEIYTSAQARRAQFLMAGRNVGVTRPASALTTPLSTTQPLARPAGVQRDAFEQFLRWEQQAGIERYRETTQFFPLQMRRVPQERVTVELGTHSQSTPIAPLFVRDGYVLWPSHPYNTHPNSAFAGEPAVEGWAARLTTSRSMVIWDRERGMAFSVKVGTNFPHRAEMQTGKLKSEDDVENALLRANYMRRLDQELTPHPDLIFLHEVMTLLNPVDQATHGANTTARGVVLRDLSPLLDGHYYLPAFSIPYVGRQIAAALGEDFGLLWQRGYAELLGRSKARLLLNYGLQMETPNTQNMLIQLDRNLRPTGKLVFRDMSDSIVVAPLMERMGERAVLAQEAHFHNELDRQLRIMTSNSLWRLDEHPVHGVNRATISQWARAHDVGFAEEVLALLDLPVDHPVRVELTNLMSNARSGEQGALIQKLNSFLFSEEGLQAFSNYRQRIRR